MWKSEYLNDLLKIVELAQQDKFSGSGGAVEEFKKYLLIIVDIGSFNVINWNLEWRQAVYRFGEVFSTKDPAAFIEVIKNELENKNRTQKEVILFFYTEILWNFFEQQNDYIGTELKQALSDYPANPEFHHTYSHYLQNNKNYDLALNEVLNALKLDPKNDQFINSYFNKAASYLNFLISKNKLDSAQTVLNGVKDFLNKQEYKSTYWIFRNHTNVYQDRINDHKLIAEKIDSIDEKINKKVSIVKNEFISIIGVFSAVIAFILTNVNIGLSNLSLGDMLWLILAMAVTLIIFMISISHIFYYRKGNFWSFFCQGRFWAILILFGILSLIIYLN